MYLKRSFSLLEIIFTIAIIAIIAAVAVPKFVNQKEKTDLIKIKSDILLIRDSLIKHKNKLILSNSSSDLHTLENGNDILFDKILQYPIPNSTKTKSGTWNKFSNNKYNVFINSDTFVTFSYDSTNFTFDCDKNDPYCMELTQ